MAISKSMDHHRLNISTEGFNYSVNVFIEPQIQNFHESSKYPHYTVYKEVNDIIVDLSSWN